MTPEQFKEALLKGQGRCVNAVQADPMKYRSVILWACSHEVAFDPQCEGTRAWFVYQLIDRYEDKAPFLEAVIGSLERASSTGGWKILYLAELLSHFAGDGMEAAEQALWRKYENLYHALLEDASCGKDDFAMLCQVLADDKSAMVKIAEDIGRLYRSNDRYDGGDFDWLFADKAKRHMATLKKRARSSEDIARFLRAGEADEERFQQQSQERASDPEKYRSGRSLSMWLRRRADRETVLEYAKRYLEQDDLKVRAEALQAFGWCPFPEDPLPIVEDTRSDHEPLPEAAWRALENIRHPVVRAFALEQVDGKPEKALPVLIANYRPQDEARLVDLVKSIPVDFESTIWHSIQLDVLGMEDHGLKAPVSLLRYIFESTYCSCCREYTLRQMAKRRVLDQEVLEECLLDSNYDIRTYAARCMARRRKRAMIAEASTRSE